mmetsp:Transcript_16285/g.53079  ORF Transcript_16285/g.53079 Transcript_16285/m.53079 type:complete len:233 (-) Transcript_16285:69-767(-)
MASRSTSRRPSGSLRTDAGGRSRPSTSRRRTRRRRRARARRGCPRTRCSASWCSASRRARGATTRRPTCCATSWRSTASTSTPRRTSGRAPTARLVPLACFPKRRPRLRARGRLLRRRKRRLEPAQRHLPRRRLLPDKRTCCRVRRCDWRGAVCAARVRGAWLWDSVSVLRTPFPLALRSLSFAPSPVLRPGDATLARALAGTIGSSDVSASGCRVFTARESLHMLVVVRQF